MEMSLKERIGGTYCQINGFYMKTRYETRAKGNSDLECVHYESQSCINHFTITAEICARSLAIFHCQYADGHMGL